MVNVHPLDTALFNYPPLKCIEMELFFFFIIIVLLRIKTWNYFILILSTKSTLNKNHICRWGETSLQPFVHPNGNGIINKSTQNVRIPNVVKIKELRFNKMMKTFTG